MMNFDFGKTMTRKRQAEFAEQLQQLQDRIGFRISSRGWCYQLESERIINKDEFDRVEDWINACRKSGVLPVDFVIEDVGRQFSGVETPDVCTPEQFLARYLDAALCCEEYYTPDWWGGEACYVQMLVEKVDLKTLFEPVCHQYHIPIATTKGWSSVLQRAEYAARFRQAEERGLQCVLLYGGDHDPAGLRISDNLRENLEELQNICWSDGRGGYDPQHLLIDRFGLNADFIERHNLTWIDNLITGSGKDLADPKHHDHRQAYVQTYLKQFGARKCEANAIVPIPQIARQFVQTVIERYVGQQALGRFAEKRNAVAQQLTDFRQTSGIDRALRRALQCIN